MASCAGRDAHTTPLMGAEHVLEGISHRHAPSQFVLGTLKESRAAKQLGTLGGGNHFLEVASSPLQPCHCLACISLLAGGYDTHSDRLFMGAYFLSNALHLCRIQCHNQIIVPSTDKLSWLPRLGQ